MRLFWTLRCSEALFKSITPSGELCRRFKNFFVSKPSDVSYLVFSGRAKSKIRQTYFCVNNILFDLMWAFICKFQETNKIILSENLRLGLGVDEVEVLGVLRAFLFLGALKPASEDGDGVPSSTSLLFTCCKHKHKICVSWSNNFHIICCINNKPQYREMLSNPSGRAARLSEWPAAWSGFEGSVRTRDQVRTRGWNTKWWSWPM